MLTILWGFVLGVLFWIISIFTDYYALMFCGVLVMLIFGILGYSAPLSGYEEWKLVKEFKLVPFENKKDIYVKLNDEYIYEYRYKEEILGIAEFWDGSIEWERVEKIELPTCEEPVLRKYSRKAKKSIWTYGKFEDKKYVFVVPNGSILKEIE